MPRENPLEKLLDLFSPKNILVGLGTVLIIAVLVMFLGQYKESLPAGSIERNITETGEKSLNIIQSGIDLAGTLADNWKILTIVIGVIIGAVLVIWKYVIPEGKS
jgi:hypothetical protein